MKIKAPLVYSDGQQWHNQVLHLREGWIERIEPASPHVPYDAILPEGSVLLPGLIDLHIHGANGADVMDASPEALKTISQTLAQDGVTGFLATTMTESAARIEAAIDNSVACQTQQIDQAGAQILGLHLEGPFLSQTFMGAQCPDYFLEPNADLLTAWQTRASGTIKLLTLAPELPHALQLIDQAKALDIVTSIGHTAATYQETAAAVTRGARHATHLFNAMSGLHHRTPGAAAALLMDDRVTAELIADGLHIAPEMVYFALRCKGLDRVVLVSDAMHAKCLKNGEYTFGGQTIILQDQAVRLKKNGALAGSTLCLNQALYNAHAYSGYPLEKLVPLVTSIPARILKLDHLLGAIRPGLKANLTVLNQADGAVLHTLREGRSVYKNPALDASLAG